MPVEDRSRVLLTALSGQAVRAHLIHIFCRDDTNPTEAPTFRNMALAILHQAPASRVALVATARPVLLFLIEIGHHWFDITGTPVRLTGVGPRLQSASLWLFEPVKWSIPKQGSEQPPFRKDLKRSPGVGDVHESRVCKKFRGAQEASLSQIAGRLSRDVAHFPANRCHTSIRGKDPLRGQST
jgi:hypothetical protein